MTAGCLQDVPTDDNDPTGPRAVEVELAAPLDRPMWQWAEFYDFAADGYANPQSESNTRRAHPAAGMAQLVRSLNFVRDGLDRLIQNNGADFGSLPPSTYGCID